MVWRYAYVFVSILKLQKHFVLHFKLDFFLHFNLDFLCINTIQDLYKGNKYLSYELRLQL